MANAVHCAVDDPGGIEPVMAQGGDEGLGVPVAERRMVDQACALCRPACSLRHVRLERGLINETNARQQLGHEWLPPCDPDMARLANLRPLLLDGLQVFFYASGRDCAACARPTRDGLSFGAHSQFPAPDHPA